MKKAFITGGTGFIGSHLTEELLRRKYEEVRCLVRDEPKWLAGLDIVPVRANLFDRKALEGAVRDVDAIYHVGGVTRAQDRETFHRNNVDATVTLLETVARVNPDVERIIVTSTLAVVGPCRTGVATEDMPMRPLSRYGRSKAVMERRIREWSDTLPITVIRPPAVYGPRERDIYTFFKALSRGICPIVGSVHGPALSLIHVDDLVRGMVDAAESDATAGHTYFLGSEIFYSWNDVKLAAATALERRVLTIAVPSALVLPVGALVELIGTLSGTYPPLNREKAREIRRVCKMCSIEKAKRDFGFSTSTPLERGIAETIEWYKQHGWL